MGGGAKETGNPQIDAQHRVLETILRRILHILKDNPDYKRRRFVFMEGIHFLENYVNHHFQDEEVYMREIGYRRYAEHKRYHDHLRDVVLPEIKENMEKRTILLNP